MIFHTELAEVVETFSGKHPHTPNGIAELDVKATRLRLRLTSKFLKDVAVPMLLAFVYHKARHYGVARSCIALCLDRDWKTVGREWLDRRERLYTADGPPASDPDRLAVDEPKERSSRYHLDPQQIADRMEANEKPNVKPAPEEEAD